ncbi:MAG: twin-arginine translocase TatA/TatE family subunit [Victivallales bacterium]|nr:twin-arginine translocase TatA/TatE family subunit [Victivallales bacterium]
MSLGFTEIIVIALFILLVFGAKRIPELARALGRASYEFKKAKNELSQESKDFVEAAEDAAAKEDAAATAKQDASQEKKA